MRKAFGLVQALLVIVLLSGIMVIAMKYANVTIKQTSDMYARESVELFMDSAVELTLLAISGYDRQANGNCLETVNLISPDGRYDASVSIQNYYLLAGSTDCTLCGVRCVPVGTEDSHGMVLLEMVVATNALHPKNRDKAIRLTRRTLQRP